MRRYQIERNEAGLPTRMVWAGDDPPRPCAICQQPGTVTRKALNGLPVGVVACEDCRQAVQRREVGVVVRADGSLSITDGRHLVMDAPVHVQPQQTALDFQEASQ